MRLGVFGGSFDPVHFGHLRMAEEARTQADLDRVLFVPTQVSPFKVNRQVTPGELRLQMLHIAVEDNPAFAVSEVEVARPGPSYTVDTLRLLREQYPTAELFFLTGTDAVRDLPKWRQPEEILSLSRFLVAARPGVDRAEVLQALPDTWEGRVSFIEMPELDISSTYLRERIRDGRSVRYLLPRAVETFIAAHGLYRETHGATGTTGAEGA
jgi:nicotinate-nucleotide adenylyltransferase